MRDNLEKAITAATAAVEVYNRPGSQFRTAHYITLIVIAWTALFHAIFYKQKKRPWYRKPNKGLGVRYIRIDGDPKHWELAECLNNYFGDHNPPERSNLLFLIRLRNKIEHRHLPHLDSTLYGECQAALMNFEETLVRHFGPTRALTHSLAFSLQFSRTVPEAKSAALRALSAQAKSVKDFIEKFRGDLPIDILNSIKYSFSVYLVPKASNRASSADVSVEFVRYDPARPEDVEHLAKVVALIREKHIPVMNADTFRPSDVVRIVRDRLPFKFNESTHVRAWKHYDVRPATGSKTPEKTNAKYCFYDKVHRDYVYTQAWVELLVSDLADPDKFLAMDGKAAVPKADVGAAR